ncbi:hypothetical protein Ccrd_026663 [Cynara cardunculus var. scolymus]|uniref:Uncharacterized protein n=1 Tax=Cynara cardunculus var. scolymus TaxID=59895 RepID=A0A103LQN6_CYNCS|nr:hypothetical protein Ccrd_026663 [Cynara cardunculus var. scolymus]
MAYGIDKLSDDHWKPLPPPPGLSSLLSLFSPPYSLSPTTSSQHRLGLDSPPTTSMVITGVDVLIKEGDTLERTFKRQYALTQNKATITTITFEFAACTENISKHPMAK